MTNSALRSADDLRFGCDGAQRVRAVLDADARGHMTGVLGDVRTGRPGVRLHGIAALRPILAPSGRVGAVAAAFLGPTCRPVRALLFDKNVTMNWSLAWHQDRTIAVAERVDVDGFGPWTVKDGVVHVAPPFEILSGMATLRVHLDPVPATNAPLLVAPGSHRHGRVAERDVPEVVRRCGSLACCAEAGDIWITATAILHASEAAAEPTQRRVLQVDYALGDLAGGLRWLGV